MFEYVKKYSDLSNIDKSYVLVNDTTTLINLLTEIHNNDLIAFDTETTSLNVRKAEIIGFSVTTKPGNGFYFPTLVYDPAEDKLVPLFIEDKPAEDIAKRLIKMLINKKLIMHNGAYDVLVVKNYYGIDLLNSLYADTILLIHTVQEEGADSSPIAIFQLKEVAKSIQEEIGLEVEKEANEEQIKLKESIIKNGGEVTKKNFEIYKADLQILSDYGSADTDLTFRTFIYFSKVLKEEGLEEFFYKEEVMPLYIYVTIPMEERGVQLDIPLLGKSKVSITEDMEKLKNSVINKLMENDTTQAWLVTKAETKYPASNKGNFAQELCHYYNLDLPISEKSGKFSLTKKNILTLPENNPIKEYLVHGQDEHLEDLVKMEISLKMWKDANDGNPINVQSKTHLGEIIFDYMKIKPLSKTAKGKPQVNETLIESLKDKYDWAKDLHTYNKLLKIKSTYIDRFLENNEDGRYYFYYKQFGTTSGRYGSDAQQLPRPMESEEGEPLVVQYNNLIRAFMIAEENRIFIDCDYESLEPRVFAHVSGDDGLKDIFRKGHDFYSTIAIKTEKLQGVSADKKADNYLKKVDPVKRQRAKPYALGIPYGMSFWTLAQSINVSNEEAKELMEGYLSGFPSLRQWMDDTRYLVKNYGMVKNQLGRIRHLKRVKQIYDHIGDSLFDWKIKKKLEDQFGKDAVVSIMRDYVNGINNSFNFQIQSLAAGIVNRAAIAMSKEFKAKKIDAYVCAQIHDQIIVNVPKDKAEICAKIVKDRMENTTKISIELKAPPEVAKNWKEGH